MRLCQTCAQRPVARWERVCEACASSLEEERAILWLGRPLLRWRVLSAARVLSILPLAGLVGRFVVAPIVRSILPLFPGRLADALDTTFEELTLLLIVLLAFGAILIAWSELRGTDGITAEISNVRVRRWIDSKPGEGTWPPTVYELSLLEVRSVEVDQGWLARRLSYGNLAIYAGSKATLFLKLPGVPSPRQAKRRIEALVAHLRSTPALLARAQKLPPATFDREAPKAESSSSPAHPVLRWCSRAVVLAAVIGLPTYCNLKMVQSVTLRPGETREVPLSANVMLRFGPPTPTWDVGDAGLVKGTVREVVDGNPELVRSVESRVAVDDVSLQELGSGPSDGMLATVNLTATVQAAADAPDGDLELIITLTHPKFGTETFAKLALRVRRTGR